MLQRMNELAVKAANGTLQSVDRSYIDSEVQKLKDEITAVARKTTFNELELFPPDGCSPNDTSAPNVLGSQDFEISFNGDGSYTITASDPMVVDKNMVDRVAAAPGWQKLAKHIADELIPKAVDQIVNTFTPFKTAGENINVALRVEYIDGPSGTLAYAQFGYRDNGTDVTAVKDSFLVKVDTADFSDDTLGSEKEEELESTLAHELMHTVMQNTLTKGMAKEYPLWFKEGTAQLAGGGMTTGWNDYLREAVKDLSSDTDD